MRPRILIFSLGYFPNAVGGAEVSVKEITDRLPEYEFHLICNRYNSALPHEETIGNVRVHRIGITRLNPDMSDLKKLPLMLNKPLYQFLAAWKAIQLHRNYHFSATWAVMAHATGVPAALFKMWNPRVPYILNLQEGDPPEYIEKKMRLLAPLFARAFTLADIVQPLSSFLARWAERMGFEGPIEIIPNAVNTKAFSTAFPASVINDIKDQLDKKMGDVFLITTSRLVHKNAVDDVITALKDLPANVLFVILGTGPLEGDLKRQASKFNVHTRVHFVGHVGHEDLPKYLQASDIFIRPSRSEGFGASFVEAMAAGLPVIATQEGGLADFLFDAKRNPDKPITGWAVDANAPQQIVAAVHDIMAHPEKVRAVVAVARALVEEKYDWDIIARDMRDKVIQPLLTD